MSRLAQWCVAVFVVSLVAPLFGVSSAQAAKPKEGKAELRGWTNNFELALAASKSTGRPMLMVFTGSDWCGFCKKLKAEVFDTPEFQQWAEQNVVLMEVDFPRGAPQEEAVKQQNAALRAKFPDIAGFPMVKFVSPNEEEMGSLRGYSPGTGPEKWLANATAAINAKPEMLAKPVAPQPDEPPAAGLTILSSYKEGLAAAQKDGRPLLLVISKSDAEKLQANLAKLLADERFTQFAEESVVVAHVKEPIESDPEEQEAIAALRKENNLRQTPLQMLLIDVKSEKVLMKSVVLPDAKVIVPQLQRRIAVLEKA